VTLAVGTLEENVTVTGDSALVVQTQTPSIAMVAARARLAAFAATLFTNSHTRLLSIKTLSSVVPTLSLVLLDESSRERLLDETSFL
jgi:hypothetical protein